MGAWEGETAKRQGEGEGEGEERSGEVAACLGHGRRNVEVQGDNSLFTMVGAGRAGEGGR